MKIRSPRAAALASVIVLVVTAPAAANGVIAPGGANNTGVLIPPGGLTLLPTSIYQCETAEWDSTNVPDPWNPIPLTGPVNDKIHGAAGNVTLGGTLDLTALSKLHPSFQAAGQPPGVTIEWHGEQTRTIVSAAAGNSVLGQFDTLPDTLPIAFDLPGTGNWGQGHIGRGVFLTGSGHAVTGITYGANATEVHLFQACDGDTNGDGNLDGSDIQAILAANSFGKSAGGPWDFISGDFDIDGDVDGNDIQAILSTGLWGTPQPYGGPADQGPPVVDFAEVILDPATGELKVDTHGHTINGYVIQSAAGIFTGGPADNLGWFHEDTDQSISGNMGFTLNGEHSLGNVVGPGSSGDITFTYTLQDQPGTFTGDVTPEPATLSLLALGGMAVLRRRRSR